MPEGVFYNFSKKEMKMLLLCITITLLLFVIHVDYPVFIWYNTFI